MRWVPASAIPRAPVRNESASGGKCPRGSAAFRIAGNTDYCQGADDSYIGLHQVSVNPIPQAYPSRITQLDWRSCVAGETLEVAGVEWAVKRGKHHPRIVGGDGTEVATDCLRGDVWW